MGSAVGVAPGWSVLLPGRLAHPNIGELEPGHKEVRWADTNVGAIWESSYLVGYSKATREAWSVS